MKTCFKMLSVAALVGFAAASLSAMSVVVGSGPHYSPGPITFTISSVNVPNEHVDTSSDYFGNTYESGRQGVFCYIVTPRRGTQWLTAKTFGGASNTLTYDIALPAGDYQFYIEARARAFEGDHYAEDGYYDSDENWQSTGWRYVGGGSWDDGYADGGDVAVSLTVDPNGAVAPTFTTQPPPQLSVHAGQGAAITVAATGIPAPTITWFKTDPWNNTVQVGTGPTLTLTNVTWNDNGMRFNAFAANSAGTMSSWPTTLTVLAPLAPPTITTQPTSVSVASGTIWQWLEVVATGVPEPGYQWRKDGVNIPGANSPSYLISPVEYASAGAYSVVVSNSEGSVTSSTATVTVTPPWTPAPQITTQPVSQTVDMGQSATLSVAVSGMPPFTFQWRKNGANIAGATLQQLTLGPVSASDAGAYNVTVTNTDGSATSNSAVLTINGVAPPDVPLMITQQPQSQTVVAGSTITLTSGAYSTVTPILYQWRKNGANILGATNTTLTLTKVQPSDQGVYKFAAANNSGAVESTAALLAILPPSSAPTITTQPQSQSVATGGTVSFTVSATGSPPPVFQWKKDGVNIIGATNNSLLLINAQPEDIGTYSVSATNGSGSATSNGATLAVGTSTTTTLQSQVITFSTTRYRLFEQGNFRLTASASSGLLVSYSIVSGPAQISDDIITPTGLGVVTIRASQSGNTVFAPATSIDSTFTIVSIKALPSAAYIGIPMESIEGAYGNDAAATTPSQSPNLPWIDITGDGILDELMPTSDWGFVMAWEGFGAFGSGNSGIAALLNSFSTPATLYDGFERPELNFNPWEFDLEGGYMQMHLSWEATPGYTYRIIMLNRWLGATIEHPIVLAETSSGTYDDTFASLFGLDGSSFFVVRVGKVPTTPNWNLEGIAAESDPLRYYMADRNRFLSLVPKWGWDDVISHRDWGADYSITDLEGQQLWAAAEMAGAVLAPDAPPRPTLPEPPPPEIEPPAVPDQVRMGALLALLIFEKVVQQQRLSYVLYEKPHKTMTGKWYSGRTGPWLGDPAQVLAKRDSKHDRNVDHGPAILVAYIQTKGLVTRAAYAMRGREQQLIDSHGGFIPPQNGVPAYQLGLTNSTNSARGVATYNEEGYSYWLTSNFMFGPLAPYTGDEWTKIFGFVTPLWPVSSGQIIKVAPPTPLYPFAP